MAAIRSSAWLALPLAGLCACTGEAPSENEQASVNPATVAPQAACTSHRFESTTFTVCRFDAARDELRLAWRGADGAPLRSLAALQQSLGADVSRVRFAMNAGMYDEEGAPIGLFVEDGEKAKPLNLRPGPGNFHLLPNGVLSADSKGGIAVTQSAKFKATIVKPRWATQSGPMLVIGGKLHPKFDADGPSRLIRNGVGVRDAGSAFFVISEEAVSFGRFARLFRDALGCPDALYLDGTVSSLWDANTGRQDSYAGLGPMLVVMSR